MKIIPNNWAELQHYKDRSPPWIKLHKKLLDNFEWHSLPIASRALAPMLWLLASENEMGEIDASPKKIAFRLRMTERDASDALKPLIDNGFFSVVHIDSNSLAERYSGARPETETETEEETEEEADICAEPQSDSTPVLFLPLINGEEYGVDQSSVDEWSLAYPAVDVLQQLRAMASWCKANPANRKTARGIKAFVVRWLGKAQDKAPRSNAGAERPAETPYQRSMRERWEEATGRRSDARTVIDVTPSQGLLK